MLLKLAWPVRKASHLQHRVEKRQSIDAWFAGTLLGVILLLARFINTFVAICFIPGHFFNDIHRVLAHQSRAFLGWKQTLGTAASLGFLSCFETVAYPSQVMTTVDAFWMAVASYPIAVVAAPVYLLPAWVLDLVIGALLKLLRAVGVRSPNRVSGAVQWLSPFAYRFQDSETRIDKRASAIGWLYCLIFVFIISYPVVWSWSVLTTRLPASLVCMILGFVGCLRPYRELLASSRVIPPEPNHRRVMEKFITELCRQTPTSTAPWPDRNTAILHQWRRWRSSLVREERRARTFGDDCLNQLLKERRDVYQSNRSELFERLKAIEGLPSGVTSDLRRILEMLPIGTLSINS
jgi:hypothetical protein